MDTYSKPAQRLGLALKPAGKWKLLSEYRRSPIDDASTISTQDAGGAWTLASPDGRGILTLLAVADGHGGQGHVISARVVATLTTHFLAAWSAVGGRTDCDMDAVAARTVEDLSAEVDKLDESLESGSTLMVCIVVEIAGEAPRATFAWLGDSWAEVHDRATGKRVYRSDDESHRASNKGEQERVEREREHEAGESPGTRAIWKNWGVWRLNGQLMLTRALGDRHLRCDGLSTVPSVETVKLGSADVIILCTDGVNCLDTDVIAEALHGSTAAGVASDVAARTDGVDDAFVVVMGM